MKTFLTALALSTLAASASAQFYAGGTLGWAHIPLTCDAGTSCEDNDVGYRLHVGYDDTAKIAGELGYLNFGKADAKANVGSASSRIKAQAITIGLAFRQEFQPGLKGVLRVGAAHVNIKQTFSAAASDEGSGFNPHVGLGLEYAFMPNLQAIGAIDVTQGSTDGGNKGGLYLFSAGVQYRF